MGGTNSGPLAPQCLRPCIFWCICPCYGYAKIPYANSPYALIPYAHIPYADFPLCPDSNMPRILLPRNHRAEMGRLNFTKNSQNFGPQDLEIRRLGRAETQNEPNSLNKIIHSLHLYEYLATRPLSSRHAQIPQCQKTESWLICADYVSLYTYFNIRLMTDAL